jgi:hypothetical protein
MLPRLTTEFWVHALLRRCAGEGLFGAVLHKGNAEAGALMVVINHCDGGYTLLAPPPGPAYDAQGTRQFEKRGPAQSRKRALSTLIFGWLKLKTSKDLPD